VLLGNPHGKNAARFLRDNNGDSAVVVVESPQPNEGVYIRYIIFRDCWKVLKSCLVDCAATLDCNFYSTERGCLIR
jgi:hypothetical protein